MQSESLYYRHGELRRRLGCQPILARTLRNLESSGPITRSVTGSKSLAVDRSLNPGSQKAVASTAIM